MIRPQESLRIVLRLAAGLALVAMAPHAPRAEASFITYTAAGESPAAIAPTVDSFRAALGSLAREITWDDVPDGLADPNPFPANYYNANVPLGVSLSTPGTGFLVSSTAGSASPTLFGFPNDFQAYSSPRIFTALNSNVVDVSFFLPGTATPAVTSAFGVIFIDVEINGSTKIEFFNESNALIYSQDALVAGNQGLSFVGAIASAGERISRVRITSGSNTIVANGQLGNPNDDAVAMDNFLFAAPVVAAAVPEPASLTLLGLGLALGAAHRCRRRPSTSRR